MRARIAHPQNDIRLIPHASDDQAYVGTGDCVYVGVISLGLNGDKNMLDLVFALGEPKSGTRWALYTWQPLARFQYPFTRLSGLIAVRVATN
jgi:hypothetical protein